MLVPGTKVDSSRQALALAEREADIYAAVGVHPNDALTWDTQALQALHALAISPRVAAIGEIGLDYYWDAAPPALQQQVLQAQLALAARVHKPVILHTRDKQNAVDGPCMQDELDLVVAWTRALKTQNHPLAQRPGVIHSFSGSLSLAWQAIEAGFYIGITGSVTFKNAQTLQALVCALPLERILIETDSPFLAPHPYRGQRNEPAYVALVAHKIAALRGLSPQEVAQTTTENAARLFGWA
ncbi:MAG: TatD family hydrolase [Anaerolineales bacterium]